MTHVQDEELTCITGILGPSASLPGWRRTLTARPAQKQVYGWRLLLLQLHRGPSSEFQLKPVVACGIWVQQPSWSVILELEIKTALETCLHGQWLLCRKQSALTHKLEVVIEDALAKDRIGCEVRRSETATWSRKKGGGLSYPLQTSGDQTPSIEFRP